jgi:SpoVK/Ycf46/Vps4 family AAA+-type ATPase
MPETYKNTVERLKERGMRTGFACLFYGESGTGKTETVNMIAKNTGRDIMAVDISKTKSCWFGESEKKIKEVFDKYRAYVEACENAPILLLNEADAIIGKRKEVSAGNTAQTENAIQNIILQELENLNGILLATTNLTQNMDKAFERRFLYKIEFEKPAPAIRELLWKEMIPELSDSDARMLAEKFDFSGGQIENIARKRTVDFVISGGQYSIDKLIEYCRDERLEKVNKPIGFGKF